MSPRSVALLVPLLLAVVVSWTRIALEGDDVPRDEDYVAARALLVAEGFATGGVNGGGAARRDALVILPPWSLRPLQVLGDLEPISGDAIADRPLHRWARLWAIVEPDDGGQRAALVARRGPPSFSQRVGRLVVERWDLPAQGPVTYDLAARLEDARVRVVGDASSSGASSSGSGPRDCERIARGFRCGSAHWQRVRREWLLVSENADLAVFAHPPAPGARLELSWPDVPVGAAVVVTAGFTRDGAGNARAPVRLRVLVDGDLVGTVVRAPAFAFATDVIDTARFAGRAATVTIAIDSDDSAGAHFAFDAYTVGAP